MATKKRTRNPIVDLENQIDKINVQLDKAREQQIATAKKTLEKNKRKSRFPRLFPAKSFVF